MNDVMERPKTSLKKSHNITITQDKTLDELTKSRFSEIIDPEDYVGVLEDDDDMKVVRRSSSDDEDDDDDDDDDDDINLDDIMLDFYNQDTSNDDVLDIRNDVQYNNDELGDIFSDVISSIQLPELLASSRSRAGGLCTSDKYLTMTLKSEIIGRSCVKTDFGNERGWRDGLQHLCTLLSDPRKYLGRFLLKGYVGGRETQFYNSLCAFYVNRLTSNLDGTAGWKRKYVELLKPSRVYKKDNKQIYHHTPFFKSLLEKVLQEDTKTKIFYRASNVKDALLKQ
jgi:hypothetical protein